MSEANVLDFLALLPYTMNGGYEVGIGTDQHSRVVVIVVGSRKQIDGYMNVYTLFLEHTVMF